MVAADINLGGTALKPVGWDRSIIFLNIIFLKFFN